MAGDVYGMEASVTWTMGGSDVRAANFARRASLPSVFLRILGMQGCKDVQDVSTWGKIIVNDIGKTTTSTVQKPLENDIRMTHMTSYGMLSDTSDA